MTNYPLNGGEPCGALTEKMKCNLGECAAKCIREWGEWSGCTASCDGGTQFRQGRLLEGTHITSMFVCPTKQERVCNEAPCPTTAPTSAPSVSPTTAQDDDDDDLTGGPVEPPTPDCKDECPACCLDGSGGGLHQNCHDSDHVLRDYARKTCRKTCGICVLPTHAPTMAPTQVPVYPTLAPTAKPTFDRNMPKCKVGNNHFEHGWQGGGLDENYCNLCRCHMGMMICTRRKCGIPKNLPEDATECEHLTCSYKQENEGGRSRIFVHHKSLEMHRDHSCAYNRYDGKCACYCWNKIAAHYRTYPTAGQHRFGGLVGFLTHHCENVPFPESYDPAKGDVQVVTTVAHTSDVWAHHAGTHAEHDPVVSWIETSSHLGFTVCARADQEYWHAVWNSTKSRHEHYIDVDYYAWQGTSDDDLRGFKPFGGALSGSTEMVVPTLNYGETACDTVQFPDNFKSLALNSERVHYPANKNYPLVFGNIDRKSDDVHGVDRVAVTHWMDRIDDNEFEVCFRRFSEEHEMPSDLKFGIPGDATMCTYLTCTAQETSSKRVLIKTHSSGVEPHRNHRCEYEESKGDCVCSCWTPIPEQELPVAQPLFFSWMAFQPEAYMSYDAPYRAAGRHLAASEWVTYESVVHQKAWVKCEEVVLTGFLASIKPIVIASATCKDMKHTINHGLMTWVDNISFSKFKVCTVLSGKEYEGSIQDVSVVWDWAAFLEHSQPRNELAA